MARVKRGVEANRRHKKILKQAKGYYGARSRVYRVAVQAVTKAGQYAYRDRRVKKRTFRPIKASKVMGAVTSLTAVSGDYYFAGTTQSSIFRVRADDLLAELRSTSHRSLILI